MTKATTKLRKGMRPNRMVRRKPLPIIPKPILKALIPFTDADGTVEMVHLSAVIKSTMAYVNGVLAHEMRFESIENYRDAAAAELAETMQWICESLLVTPDWEQTDVNEAARIESEKLGSKIVPTLENAFPETAPSEIARKWAKKNRALERKQIAENALREAQSDLLAAAENEEKTAAENEIKAAQTAIKAAVNEYTSV